MTSEASTVIDLSSTPQTIVACWMGAWDGYEPVERTEALESLAATIDHAFNVRDGDGDQGYLLEQAVLAAADYIQSQPCTCTDDEPCPRCFVLNRWHDVQESR